MTHSGAQLRRSRHHARQPKYFGMLGWCRTHARREAHRHYAEVVRGARWRFLIALGVGYAAVVLARWAWPTVVSGVVLGVLLAVPPWMLSLIVAGDPTAARWARGADAEDWTAEALRRHLPAGWCVAHDVQFANFNADHVVVAPVGVVVLETKWQSKPWATDPGYSKLRVAGRQCRYAAEHVRRRLKTAGIDCPMLTAVVVWGGDIRQWSEDTRVRTVDGVTVVAGVGLKQWITTLERLDAALDAAAMARIATVIAGDATSRSPVPART